MSNAAEMVESLQGLHEALRHVIEAVSETVINQEAEIKGMRENVDYWKYQLEIRGIELKESKPGMNTDTQITPVTTPPVTPGPTR